MIRNGVGAIVFQGNEFLIVKRGLMLTKGNIMKKIPGEWDLVKGGIESGETPEQAILRELVEETGSAKYRIIKRFKDDLNYQLPSITGFDGQETMMYLVEYLGDRTEIKPDAKEITTVGFFSKSIVLSRLKYEETKEFFGKYA